MAVNIIPLRHIASFPTNHNSNQSRRRRFLSLNPAIYRCGQLHRRFKIPVKCYKELDFQDFQGYAKPLHLLPAKDLEVCSETSPEKNLATLCLDESRSFFKIKIKTSTMCGSSLSDDNGGILLCLIDESGDSVLQRIPAILKSDSMDSDALYFQRSSIDEFTFEGPKLGRIEALWIGVESGQWRVGSVNVIVISTGSLLEGETEGQKIEHSGYLYEFEVDDMLLGEGSNISILELRPRLVSELNGVDSFSLLSKSLTGSLVPPDGRISNEESMKEYTDLKLSLLSYDAGLILIGTLIANLAVGEDTAFAFFIGGVGGFSYLLLLQRSVDELPASSSSLRTISGSDQLFGGFKAPVLSLALAVGLAALVAKYSFGDASLSLTPRDLMVGMMGFLVCKVAVVIAAFKPMSLGVKED